MERSFCYNYISLSHLLAFPAGEGNNWFSYHKIAQTNHKFYLYQNQSNHQTHIFQATNERNARRDSIQRHLIRNNLPDQVRLFLAKCLQFQS